MNDDYLAFLKTYVADLKGIEVDKVDENADIFELNYLNSLNVFALLVEIEAKFQIELGQAALLDERFRTLAGIATLLAEK